MRQPSMQTKVMAATAACTVLAGCGDARVDDKVVGVPPPPTAEIVPASAALQGSNVPTLDPATMDDAEMRRVVGDGPRCEFRYTSGGKPVLAVRQAGSAGAAIGVAKLNGKLVELRGGPAGNDPQAFSLVADKIALTVRAKEDVRTSQTGTSPRVEADMQFNVSHGESVSVGYGGYYSCARSPDRTPGAPAS